jgi:alkanesulfonate monooxygenase SsuD/methylene tetrahydromethanopterin reductase-like flavin-dependent oxidoreductase (luciferase family)
MRDLGMVSDPSTAHLQHIKVGVGLPTLATPGTSGDDGLVAAARHAETLGFDSVFAADLIIGDGSPALDAVVAVATAGTATERIAIGFGVLSLPLRPVAWLASQVQALQHVCGNRVLLGVGAGGTPDAPFWRAVGVSARERGQRTDAALKVLAPLIAGEPTRLEDQPGQPTVSLAPGAPVPPILVGGNSQLAIRRAARYGDGWFPSQIGPDTLAAGVATLAALAADCGRPTPAVHVGGLSIVDDQEDLDEARAQRRSFVEGLPGNHGISSQEAMATVTSSPAEAAERMAAYSAAGADQIVFSPSLGSGGRKWLGLCDRIAEARALIGSP